MSILEMPNFEQELIDYKCPICSNDNFDILFTHERSQITLSLCKYCGHIFHNKWLNKEASEKFRKDYHRRNPNSFINYYSREWSNFSIIKLHTPKEYLESKDRFLAYGAGAGKALTLIKKEYDFKNVIGCEESRILYSWANEHFKDIDIRNTIDIEDKSFDFISILGWITNVLEPRKFLEKVRSQINEDGRLLLTCPILEKPHAVFINNGIAQEYGSFFTQDTLFNLLGVCGFEIEKFNYDLGDILIIAKPDKQKDLNRTPEKSKFEFNRYLAVLNAFQQKDFESAKKLNTECIDAWVSLAHP
jgi:SAM-dependent methyltransferase